MARKSRKPEAMQSKTAEAGDKKNFRVAAYIRLSAEDRRVKGDSIATQQAIISSFVSKNPDLELVEFYIDNGLSGQSFERPEFKRMIADIENGKINCCTVKDLSRLGRNAIDAGFYIEKYFPSKDVRFIAIDDEYDSNRSDLGGVALSLKNVMNEAFALEIGRKIKQSKQANISKGKFVGRLAPYGYLKSKDDKRLLVPDPTAAPIVRRIFEMLAEDNSVMEVKDWLDDNKILPPKQYFHSIGLTSQKDAGTPRLWSRGVIYSILKNQMYCGDMVQGRSSCYSYKVTAVAKSAWVIVKNTHKGIVERELFEQVRMLMRKTAASPNFDESAGAANE